MSFPLETKQRISTDTELFNMFGDLAHAEGFITRFVDNADPMRVGHKTVKIYGRPVEIRAEIAKMDGLSAHADRRGLEALVNAHRKTLRDAFIVHGEPDAAEAFAGWIQGNTMARALVPALGQDIGL